MAKRKVIALGRGRVKDGRETDSSDSSEALKKRFRPNLSPENTDDQEQYNSESDEVTSSFSSDEDNELNGYASEPLHSTLNLPTENANSDLMNSSQYDGYHSLINSFQFFSDEESCDSDSQETESKFEVSTSKTTQKAKGRNKSDNKFYTEDKARLLTVSDNVRVIGYHLKNREVVFMDHPSSVPIIGYLTVTLLAGKASIQGYALQIDEPVTVFSQKQTGILSVVSHFCEEEQVCVMQNNFQKSLKDYLKGIPADTIRDFVKKSIRYSSTVVILQECILPPELQFVQLYSPFATSFEKRNKDAETQYVACLEKGENILNFGQEYEEIFTTIHKHLLRINQRKPGQAKAVEMKTSSPPLEDDFENEPGSENISGFRILVSGPKKSGKSTMLRYLVNRFLNKYPEVFYLDTDPGQSEFTPPGSVSLVRVEEPIFGPPYTHLSKTIKSIFTGSVTPETSPPMLMRSVSKMINYFNQHFPDAVLVVNTMGWLTGMGDVIYQHTRETLSAAVEIRLDPGLTPLTMAVEGKLLKCNVGFERDAASSTKQGDNRPSDLRDCALLSYLGQGQPSFLPPQTLNELRPVCMCWDDIAVYNFSKRLMYNRYYEALVNSVVALCRVKDSYILSPTNPDYPMTLEDDPDNECIGYGYVRAVDEEKHRLYIVTPVGPNTLNTGVNAILSGNIVIPRSVISKQDLFDVEFDYTDSSKEGRTELRKTIRKRERRQSSKNGSFYSR